jgi:hypothetical protein
MLNSPVALARRRLPWILAAGLLILTGCQEEPEIRRYQEAREETRREPWRLLGAIIPHDKQVWYFRLEGAPDQVAAQKKAFDQFIQTVRFTGKDNDKEAIAWKVPADWEQDKGDSQFRYATMRMGPEGHRLEMTVIPLPREGGADSVLKNVCRWRDQLGLEPIPDSKLGENVKNIKVDDVPVAMVDIIGFQPVKKIPRFAHAAHPEKRPADNEPLTYKTPSGWKAKPSDGINLAKFTAGPEGQAIVTVTPLGPKAGTLLENVNRWLGQIDMEKISPEQLARDVKNIVIADKDAPYVDLVGQQKRILAVMLSRPDATWFFKMIGPVDVVGKEKSAFESFARSVKFPPE